MKTKFIGSLLVLFSVVCLNNIYANHYDVYVPQAGSLAGLISAENKSTLTSLTVSGIINAVDIRIIRDSMPSLLDLNLRYASIVAYAGIEGTRQVNITYPEDELPARSFIPAETSVGIKSIVLPDGLTSIGGAAFYSCFALENVSMGENIITIKNSAFANCGSLQSITIPNSVKEIGNTVFYRCNRLDNIVLGDSVQYIGEKAFYKAYSLRSIQLKADTPPNINPNTLWGLTNQDSYFTLYVKTGKVETYQNSTHWKDLLTIKSYATTSITLDCSSPGKLSELTITPEDQLTIDEVIITGTIDARDLRWINETFSYYYYQVLKKLDLSRATIAAYTGMDGTANYGASEPYPTVVYPANEFPTFGSDASTVILPNNLQSIATKPFYGSDLTDIFIPASVKHIAPEAFAFNKRIEVDPANPYFCSENGILFNKDKTKLVAYPALNNITNTYIIPATVSVIGDYAFYASNYLTTITLPNAIDSIGNYAFANCSVLTDINLPATLKSLGEGAFKDAYSLSTITLPGSLTKIEKNTFENCGLINIVFPPTLTAIESAAFRECRKLKTIDLLSTAIKTIGNQAFSTCSALTQVTLPNSLTSVSDSLFSNCSLLLEVNIPDAVKNIGQLVFIGCDGLKQVSIGNSIESIANNAFLDAYNIIKLSIASPTPPVIIDSYLEGNPYFYSIYCTIEVPASAVETYRNTAGWGDYFNNIVGK